MFNPAEGITRHQVCALYIHRVDFSLADILRSKLKKENVKCVHLRIYIVLTFEKEVLMVVVFRVRQSFSPASFKSEEGRKTSTKDVVQIYRELA